MAKAIGYVVLPFNGYANNPNDYVTCPTREAVEAELVDYGWMNNPSLHVYKVTKGETAQTVIDSLITSLDPYPDYTVDRGPRGGVQWNRA